MTRYFCTCFDQYYIARGLAMCRSLSRYCPDSKIFVLALDDECFDFISSLDDYAGIEPVRLAILEKKDKELLDCGGSRSRAEYIFTIKSCLCHYLLNSRSTIDLITYIDADICFFSSPEPIFAELGEGSVAITPHHFAKNLQYMAEYRGYYNAGWMSFANNIEGRKCLEWFRKRCLEWCFDRVEDGKYADQKYLDGFADVAQGVVTVRNRGANLAAWNLGNGDLQVKEKQIFVDGDRLIFYHYQGLRRIFGGYYDCGLFTCQVRPVAAFCRLIFCSYIESVKSIQHELGRAGPGFSYGFRYRSKYALIFRIGRGIADLVKIALGYCVSC